MQLQFAALQTKEGEGEKEKKKEGKKERMSRSYDYHQNFQYGWNSTSQEYIEHITRMERMPSMATDVPHFPSIYKAFNSQVTDNQVICEEEHEDHLPLVNHPKHQAPEARKKVHFVEQERRAADVDRNRKTEVHKEIDVDMAADGFINHNHKNFGLYKWATFKSC